MFFLMPHVLPWPCSLLLYVAARLIRSDPALEDCLPIPADSYGRAEGRLAVLTGSIPKVEGSTVDLEAKGSRVGGTVRTEVGCF